GRRTAPATSTTRGAPRDTAAPPAGAAGTRTGGGTATPPPRCKSRGAPSRTAATSTTTATSSRRCADVSESRDTRTRCRGDRHACVTASRYFRADGGARPYRPVPLRRRSLRRARRAAPRRPLPLHRLPQGVGQRVHRLRAVAARRVRAQRRARGVRRPQLLPALRLTARLVRRRRPRRDLHRLARRRAVAAPAGCGALGRTPRAVARPGRGRLPARGEPPLADDEVHELAGHDDRLDDRAAVQVRLHLRRALRPLDELLRGRVDIDLEAVAHLAVHLDDELERRAR